MTGFFEKAKTVQENINNVAITENGAIGYRTTGKALLDLNFSIPQMRTMSEIEIQAKWADAFAENPELAMRWLFYVRDVRHGLGERRLFRVIMKWMANNYPDIITPMINTNNMFTPFIGEIIPFYGRWDDLLDLTDTPVSNSVYKAINDQLRSDIEDMHSYQPVSLLAKWRPSLTTSSAETRKAARKLCKKIGMMETPYRQRVSALRQYLNVTEVKMSNQEWNEIKYDAVPGRAAMLYRNAFMKHDQYRYSQYIADVNAGKKKINSATLYPHEIVHKMKNCNRDEHPVLEGLWRNLPRVNIDSNTIVVRDGSGSMRLKVGNSDVSALDVADALSIYFAEQLKGEFQNKIITFSESPKFIDLDYKDTLEEKLDHLRRFTEVANTNIEAVFDLILRTAVYNNMKQDELPKNILIISDMEFDSCAECNGGYHISSHGDHLFDILKEKYRLHGYQIPRVIFWNVNSRTGTIPMTENELGVVLMSGFSINAANMVMSGKTDPYECLLDTLKNPLYDSISLALGYITEEQIQW